MEQVAHPVNLLREEKRREVGWHRPTLKNRAVRRRFRRLFDFIDEKIYEDILWCFFGWKKEHSNGYVTDDRRKNSQNRP